MINVTGVTSSVQMFDWLMQDSTAVLMVFLGISLVQVLVLVVVCCGTNWDRWRFWFCSVFCEPPTPPRDWLSRVFP